MLRSYNDRASQLNAEIAKFNADPYDAELREKLENSRKDLETLRQKIEDFR